MLTHLRYFGYCFNPVTFYYCYDKSGKKVETIVAEITNTPWKQRHSYVLPSDMNLSGSKVKRFIFGKKFHVSPFLGMNYHYEMRFNDPGKQLHVYIANKNEHRIEFSANLDMKAIPFSGRSILVSVLRFPFMTGKVITGIYWEALKLKLKGVKYFPNPHIARN